MLKLVLDKEKFLNALQTASKVISAKSTIPILKNFLIESTDEGVNIVGTDNMSIFVKVSIDANIESKGKICIPAKYLVEFVNFSKDDQVVIEEKDGYTTHVSSAMSDIEIKGMDPEEFPIFPKADIGEKIEMKSGEVVEMFDNTIFATSRDLSRIRFTGVNMRIEDGKLIAASTDSFRLAEYSFGFDKGNFNIILPASAANIVQSIASAKDDKKEVTINVDKGQIAVKFEGVVLVSLLIDGDYPNYKSIIPGEAKTNVSVNVEDLQNEVRKSMIFENIANNSVNLEYDGKELIISSAQSERGNIVGKIVASGRGDNVKIACNAQFLLDALVKIDDITVNLEFNGQHGPLIMRQGLDGKNILFLVMPLKTN